jgi:hypothetical protein
MRKNLAYDHQWMLTLKLLKVQDFGALTLREASLLFWKTPEAWHQDYIRMKRAVSQQCSRWQ